MEIFLAIILAAAFVFGMACILGGMDYGDNARTARRVGFVIACSAVVSAVVLAFFVLG
jgi:hypothetical protein